MTKKFIPLVAVTGALALSLALVGCAQGGGEATSSAEPAASSEVQTGVANPWQEAATAEEAAQGAGIDGFSVVEGARLSLGAIEPWTFQYMEGIAEADSYAGASSIIVRKGTAPDGPNIAGDYNEYPAQWGQTIKGLEVTCYGHADDAASLVLWSANGYDYSIFVRDAEDPEKASSLTADDVNSLINGIQ